MIHCVNRHSMHPDDFAHYFPMDDIVGTPPPQNLRTGVPFFLRPSHAIDVQCRLQELEFDEAFLQACRFTSFDPQKLRLSNLQLLFHIGRIFGPGLNRRAFRRMMRQCTACGNIVFADRTDCHRCTGQILHVQAENFDVITALTSLANNSGLSPFDMRLLFIRCEACRNVCLRGTIYLHRCPVLDAALYDQD